MNRWSSRLASRRLELGLSQTEVAQAIGVKQSALSKMERGVLTPKSTTVRRAAAALRVDPSSLVESPAPQPQPQQRSLPTADPVRAAVDRALSVDGSALDRVRAAIRALRKIEDLLAFAEASR